MTIKLNVARNSDGWVKMACMCSSGMQIGHTQRAQVGLGPQTQGWDHKPVGSSQALAWDLKEAVLDSWVVLDQKRKKVRANIGRRKWWSLPCGQSVGTLSDLNKVCIVADWQ